MKYYFLSFSETKTGLRIRSKAKGFGADEIYVLLSYKLNDLLGGIFHPDVNPTQVIRERVLEKPIEGDKHD